MEIEVDDRYLFTLQFADDQVIIANDKDDSQHSQDMCRKFGTGL